MIDDETKQELIENLIDDLNNYLSKRPEITITLNQSRNSDYYGSGLHCSAIGSCPRQQILNYFGFERKKETLQQLLNFIRGYFYHELVYGWLWSSSRYLIIDKEKEVTHNLPFPFRGKFDVCFFVKDLKISILADIKTANSNQFKKYMYKLPRLKDIKQLTSYKYGYKNKVDLLLMMYFSNGNDMPHFHFVKPYDNIENEMQKMIDAVQRYENDKILPPPLDATFNADDVWQCSYGCPFLNLSCDGYTGEITNNKKRKI